MSLLPVKRGTFLEFVFIVACAIGMALAVQAWAVKPYQIPSVSMEPTLDVGQRVLVNRVVYHLSDPDIGDVVVFHPPAGVENADQCADPHAGSGTGKPCDRATPDESSTTFIKRIVAGPGDRLSIHRGHPVVNGVEASEDFIKRCGGVGDCNMPKEITIPPNHYFTMGDNRGSSDDSRFWGPISKDWIIGQAFVTYWPPNRIGSF
jgi:signal peptidase I